jgi:hypothetical protein
MAKFLPSGRRRDICALLADEPLQAQALILTAISP